MSSFRPPRPPHPPVLLLLLVLFASHSAQAQSGKRFVPVERRIALVIGNTRYPTCPLANPVNDAHDMAKALKRFGFQVVELEDANKQQMIEAIEAFGDRLDAQSVALFYYSGHGAQVKGSNYLIPLDFHGRKESDFEFDAVDAQRVLAQMENAKSRLNLVILDACRDNPFGKGFRFRKEVRGLARMGAPKGTLIAYATAPGDVASDNPEGRNGLYTQELLRYMATPGLEISQVFKKVRSSVDRFSHGAQVPWEEQSLENDFYFVGSGADPTPHPAPEPGPDPSKKKKSPEQGMVKINDRDSAEMVYVPAGDFLMGDDDVPINPRHTVHLSGYWIYKNLVTVRQYKQFCRETGHAMPSGPNYDPNWIQEDHPMVKVNWFDAKAYCNWAGAQLPTEAQWEKAARGTTGLKYPWGADWDADKVWCSTSQIFDAGSTAAVGRYGVSRSYGCTDMSGNVWQWCSDWYDPDFWSSRSAKEADPENQRVGEKKDRVLRGGSWRFCAGDKCFRCAARFKIWPGFWATDVGFRCVRQE